MNSKNATHWLAGAIFAVTAMPFLVAAGFAQGSTSLPEGSGREEVVAVCTSCHSTSNFAQLRHNSEEWGRIVTDMIDNGATISPDQEKVVLDYLSAHMGPPQQQSQAIAEPDAPAAGKPVIHPAK